jgi:hypothetical protein
MPPDELEPTPDMLVHIEAPDELVQHYLSFARGSGMVYSLVIKQLVSRIYRDHDYLKRREIEGKTPALGDLLRRDMAAIAWLITAAQTYVPENVRKHPVPPQPPRPRKTQRQTRQALKERDDKRKSRDIRYQQGPGDGK